MPDLKELESRVNQLTGNMLGIQTLLLALYANHPDKESVIRYFISDAKHTHAMLHGESTLPDEALEYLNHWYTTTASMLLEVKNDVEATAGNTPA